MWLQNKQLMSCSGLRFTFISFPALLVFVQQKTQANQCIDCLQKTEFLPDVSDALEPRTVGLDYFFFL